MIHTFEELMDGELHPLYFVNGSTLKMYMVKLVDTGSGGRPKGYDGYKALPKNSIRLLLYDKNGKNRIYGTWSCRNKEAFVGSDDRGETHAKYYDVDNYRNYVIYTSKDEAYRGTVHQLMEQKRKLNARILKIQEEFEIVEKRPHLSKITLGK